MTIATSLHIMKIQKVAIRLQEEKEERNMTEENKIYITASELAEMLGVSVGHAYKIIRKLNQELAEQGFLVIAGKVPRRYLEKRWYGYSA